MPEPGHDQEALLQFASLCPVGLVQMDAGGAVLTVNPMATRLLGSLAPGVDNLLSLLAPLAPDLPSLVAASDRECGTLVADRRIQLRPSASRGDPMVLTLTLLQLSPGRLMAMVADASAQAAQERRLRQDETWFAAIFNGVNDHAVSMLDAGGRVQNWNRSGERVTGFPAVEAMGRPPPVSGEPGPVEFARQLDLARRNGWHLEEGWCAHRDGTRFWSSSLISTLAEVPGEAPGFCVVTRDLSDRRQSLDEVRRLTTTDPLTGTVNRHRFFELAGAEAARWKRYGHALSVVLLDADGFQQVNEAHGHAVGDRMLRHLAGLCREELRDLDVVGRLGGGEFAILLPATDGISAFVVAERLRKRLQDTPLALEEGDALSITASFGVSALGALAPTVDALLASAGRALQTAKRTGRNRVCSTAAEECLVSTG